MKQAKTGKQTSADVAQGLTRSAAQCGASLYGG